MTMCKECFVRSDGDDLEKKKKKKGRAIKLNMISRDDNVESTERETQNGDCRTMNKRYDTRCGGIVDSVQQVLQWQFKNEQSIRYRTKE